MAVRKTIQIGDPRLYQRSKGVPRGTITTKKFRAVIRDLVDTMRKEELVGLAAPQIADMRRFFVTEVRKTKYRRAGMDRVRVYVNPLIVWRSKRKVRMYEGCGSINHGNLMGEVKRPEKVEVMYYDENGERQQKRFDGLLARIIQHEYDHLNGVLFTELVTNPRTYMDQENYLKRVMGKG